MKRIIVILAAVILLAGCVNETVTPEKTKLSYNEDTLTEDLCRFLDSALPEAEVTVNVEIKRTEADHDGIIEVLADDYNVLKVHSENVNYALQTGDYSMIEEYVERYYKNTHNYYNAPKYEDNIESARASYIAAYNERYGSARMDFYNDIVKDLPFGEKDAVNNFNNMFLVEKCTTTAEALCELSNHERVERITGWVKDPEEVPEKLIGGVTCMTVQDSLQVSITLEKDSYKYGDTVRYRATVLNTGYSTVELCLDDRDSLYPNVKFGFYENGILREDISSGYGNMYVEDEGKFGFLDQYVEEKPVPSDLVLDPGESETFYLASTPHRSCAFGKDSVNPDSEWSVKLSFTYVIDGKEGECVYEVPVSHTDE